MAQSQLLTPDYIFESSWEVCNKVGGIYTVLSTRAKTLKGLFQDNVIYLGPDLWINKSNPDFTESKSLLKAWKQHAAEKEGLRVRVGRWNIPGKPIAILIDFHPFYKEKGNIYYMMWEKYGVDSSVGYGDYDESCLFAYSVGRVIESLYRFLRLEDKKVIAHMNEWMLSMGGLYLKDRVPAIATVFTTHATSIGRSISGNDKPLYSQIMNYNGDQMAQELNMVAKHSVEKTAAHQADCFTTVSKITGWECKCLLDKEPDVITPNGFEDNFVPKGKAFDTKRKKARNMLMEVAGRLMGETIDKNALLVSISGRYEYKNKGIDVFIEAMNQIRYTRPDRQIVAFILVPGWIEGARTDLSGRLREEGDYRHPLYNPYYTHNLCAPEHDKVCGYLQHLDFLNQAEYKTKIVFVPSYLMGDDGIFNMPYYDLLIGMDMTIYPSYYEPWGYTPLESIAFGIPTITTSLAGFGLWAKEQEEKDNTQGVTVIERTDDNYFEVAEQIKWEVLAYAHLKKEERAATQNSVKALSEEADWTHFIQYYLKAYDIALRKAKKRK
ncbi:glycogen/starch synthase [Bacteroidales bacterium OttesenSCG-928-L03]|nr:glycogen/starch synthase [Bacteroidales bacterium OttesenSCG-928-L03]